MLTIEKGVPLPAGGKSKRWPELDLMEVGDSACVPVGSMESIRAAAYVISKAKGWKFKGRTNKLECTFRLWRVL